VDTPLRLDPRFEAVVERLARRGRRSLKARLVRVQDKSWLIGQSAGAAGLSWFVAAVVLGHPAPLFAPIVALVCLGMTYGQRLRRVTEATVGVSIGILVAEVIVHFIGQGLWQVILIVGLSMMVALFLDAGGFLVTQAATQSVTIAVLLPPTSSIFGRWLDAVVGGAVALLAAAIVPRAPLRRPRVSASRLAQAIADLLRGAAVAASDGDLDKAAVVLGRARQTEALVHELRSAAEEGLDVLSGSPLHRSHGAEVRRVADLIAPLDHAIRNSRVLVRRIVIAAADGEPVPASYIAAMNNLAASTEVLARVLAENGAEEVGRRGLVEQATHSLTLERTPYLSAEVILAQIRSIMVDLLQVTGMTIDEAVAAMPPMPPRPH
jgi:uncharacterized membrane protein YgaE (UPF0421/DUF939 family)